MAAATLMELAALIVRLRGGRTAARQAPEWLVRAADLLQGSNSPLTAATALQQAVALQIDTGDYLAASTLLVRVLDLLEHAQAGERELWPTAYQHRLPLAPGGVSAAQTDALITLFLLCLLESSLLARAAALAPLLRRHCSPLLWRPLEQLAAAPAEPSLFPELPALLTPLQLSLLTSLSQAS